MYEKSNRYKVNNSKIQTSGSKKMHSKRMGYRNISKFNSMNNKNMCTNK